MRFGLQASRTLITSASFQMLSCSAITLLLFSHCAAQDKPPSASPETGRNSSVPASHNTVWTDLSISVTVNDVGTTKNRSAGNQGQNGDDPGGAVLDKVATDIDSRSGGVKNVILWLDNGSSLPVHPDREQERSKAVKLTAENFEWSPYVTLLWTPGRLIVDRNAKYSYQIQDDIGARLLTEKHDATAFGVPYERHFRHAQSVPIVFSNSYRPSMKGIILMKDHPYFCVTDSDGKCKLGRVPVGTHKLVVWHESNGYIRECKLNGESLTLQRGRLSISCRPSAQNDFAFLLMRDHLGVK